MRDRVARANRGPGEPGTGDAGRPQPGGEGKGRRCGTPDIFSHLRTGGFPIRAAVLRQFHVLPRVEQVPDPVPGLGEVVVRVRAAALCASDLSIVAGRIPTVTLPLITCAGAMCWGGPFWSRKAAIGCSETRVAGVSTLGKRPSYF